MIAIDIEDSTEEHINDLHFIFFIFTRTKLRAKASTQYSVEDVVKPLQCLNRAKEIQLRVGQEIVRFEVLQQGVRSKYCFVIGRRNLSSLAFNYLLETCGRRHYGSVSPLY